MIFGAFARRLLTAAILACGAVQAAPDPASTLRFADDLAVTAREAREQRAPVMIVFTQASCIHCEIAKRDYLGPMSRSPELRGKVIIREVDIDSRKNLRDFEGRRVSSREFSRRYQVRSVPTVIVTDDGGRQLAPPVVGLLTSDFYGLYLQHAIEEGRVKMRAAQK
jgi:thioredoxin-related protein